MGGEGFFQRPERLSVVRFIGFRTANDEQQLVQRVFDVEYREAIHPPKSVRIPLELAHWLVSTN